MFWVLTFLRRASPSTCCNTGKMPPAHREHAPCSPSPAASFPLTPGMPRYPTGTEPHQISHGMNKQWSQQPKARRRASPHTRQLITALSQSHHEEFSPLFLLSRTFQPNDSGPSTWPALSHRAVLPGHCTKAHRHIQTNTYSGVCNGTVQG